MKLQISYGFNDDINFQQKGYLFLGKVTAGKGKDYHIWQEDPPTNPNEIEEQLRQLEIKLKKRKVELTTEMGRILKESKKIQNQKTILQNQKSDLEKKLKEIKADVEKTKKERQSIQREILRSNAKRPNPTKPVKPITVIKEVIKTETIEISKKEDLEQIKILKKQLKALQDHRTEELMKIEDEITELKGMKVPKHLGFEEDLKKLIKLYSTKNENPHDEILANYVKGMVNQFMATLNKMIRIADNIENDKLLSTTNKK